MSDTMGNVKSATEERWLILSCCVSMVWFNVSMVCFNVSTLCFSSITSCSSLNDIEKTKGRSK